MTALSSKALAILNARLLDPATDYDGPGAVLVEDSRIVEVVHGAFARAPDGVEVVDAGGLCLAQSRREIEPGLKSLGTASTSDTIVDSRPTSQSPPSSTRRSLGNSSRT